jgi:hypothetical protein
VPDAFEVFDGDAAGAERHKGGLYHIRFFFATGMPRHSPANFPVGQARKDALAPRRLPGRALDGQAEVWLYSSYELYRAS